MARVSTSLLLFFAAIGAAHAQAFGRFGYGEPANLPGLMVDRAGFAAKAPGACRFQFCTASSVWQPLQTTEVAQAVGLLGGERAPLKAAYDLYTPGLRLYFPNGFALKFNAGSAPFLSWAEGSVGDGVPTPNLKWALLSFQEDQPPLLFSFEGEPPSLSLLGKSGAWTIATDQPYRGWVRVCLPTGTKPFKTNSAATLGALTQRFLKEQSFWLAGPAHLLDRKIESDSLSVTCTWRFDRPGVIIPPPATLAQLGGYRISLPTRTRIIQAIDENGPLLVTDQEELTVRFPIRRVPMGRFLAEGRPTVNPPGTVSPLDFPSVMELGMENLLGSRDEATRKLGEDTLGGYFEQANYFAEPTTGQQLPFNASGVGADLAAAHAFLMQALTTAKQASSEANSLLTSLSWRTDWLSWRVWLTNEPLERRTGALAALAGALCPEPERRLEAAMLQAGLSAERGLNIYLRRTGVIQHEPLLLEPLEGVRSVLFALESKPSGTENSFARAMLSDIRVYGDVPVYLERRNGELQVEWNAPDLKPANFVLASAYRFTLEKPQNLAALEVRDALGFTRVHFRGQTPGTCMARLNAPPHAKAPPLSSAVPQYFESSH